MKKRLIKIMKKSNGMLYIMAAIYSLRSFLLIKGCKNNSIQLRGAFLKNTRIRIDGTNNIVKIAHENRLNNCLIYIKGNNCEIFIEKHCILANIELWIEDDNGKITIDYRTTAEGGHIAATEGKSIYIGKDCMFSHDIEILNGDSHAIYMLENKLRINASKSVYIGNHVWLGSSVKVLKGSTIEDGTVVSAGAIVTGHLESNSIYAGIPAKKIRENIFWERER
ncbi:MAG TPA: acyltransferase [Paludibacteraceae bacterium]|nr:acyltransferase [Paludibacteraceae bacterium]